jgi:murein DD-endopeptidase MepM/ murein hydrolase activator NlpD
MKFGNPVPSPIQAKPEKWNGKDFRVTATFKDHIVGKRPPGLDLGDGRQGDPVVAADGGTIVAAFRDPNGALVVRQRAASQVGTIIGYAHLSRISVKVGQRVTRGQQIGTVGMTGATAPHLHFGVTLNGREVDPEPYLTIGTPQEADSMTIVTFTPYPEGTRTWRAAGGQTVGYRPDGTTKTVNLAAGSSAPAGGTAVIFQDPQKAPNGSGFVRIMDGALEGYYVLRTAGTVDPAPPIRTYSQGYNDGLADAEKAVEKVPEK